MFSSSENLKDMYLTVCSIVSVKPIEVFFKICSFLLYSPWCVDIWCLHLCAVIANVFNAYRVYVEFHQMHLFFFSGKEILFFSAANWFRCDVEDGQSNYTVKDRQLVLCLKGLYRYISLNKGESFCSYSVHYKTIIL